MMKKTIFTEIIKKVIDVIFKPFKRSKSALKYLFEHTLRKELEEMLEKKEIFSLDHIHRSIRIAKKFSNQDFIILDIGGGIGVTVNLFNKAFPTNKILVFEPISDNFKNIKSRFESFSNIEVVNLAVGNVNIKKEINIANRITSSSILPLSVDSNSSVFNETNLGQNRIENIEIVKLDDFIPSDNKQIGVIKIDVQGYEMNVLQGAKETLKRTKLVLLEVSNHDGYVGAEKYFVIDNFLREHNFTLYDLIPSILDKGKLKEWDVIYVNNTALCELV
jgi:FkbM family methyltransferase